MDDDVVDALLRAGEVECALADVECPDADRVAQLSDCAAQRLLDARCSVQPAAAWLEGLAPPESLDISPAEGFAFYALHPRDFAQLATQAVVCGTPAAVIGIRSIGVTLSAVVMAALRQRGGHAQRITVRPVGHPFDRQTRFSEAQLRWIAAQRAVSAEFLVVDEGPGISGSSFLSVGDALLQAGVERQKITFLCSREVDPSQLTARDAANRWPAFRSFACGPTKQVPEDASVYIGGGEWRRKFFGVEALWPASWTQMERLKFLSTDHRRMFAFVGLGRFGDSVASRARVLAESGFGPELRALHNGFAEYPWIDGAPMAVSGLSAAVLEQLADYCALRTFEFSSAHSHPSQLESMVRFNLAQEFGSEMGSQFNLPIEHSVLADSRMLPHEFIRTTTGLVLKTDGASHGDDHFFPGPTDVAWDLAGAIIEWNMADDAVQFMLNRYRRRAGDDARHRIESYVLAYSVFRMAHCAMAAFCMRGSSEEPRLRRAWRRYRTLVEARLRSSHAVAPRTELRRASTSPLPQPSTSKQAAS